MTVWLISTIFIDYSYVSLSRLQNALYSDGSRSYSYDYDVAGNRLQEQVMIDNTGTPVTTTTNWTYNDANQIATMQMGSNPVSTFQYDDNGNLTSDGQYIYTWNRANRLTTLNTGSVNHHYTYDGLNNRVGQSVGSVATEYLLDIQPGLAVVLKESTPTETLTYAHSPRGVLAVEDGAGDYHYMLADGLRSVRTQVDDLVQVEASQGYSPYGQTFDVSDPFVGSFGYTGEQADETGQSYLRARYYNPNLGAFSALDPFEGMQDRPMSLNGYSWVEGNVSNMIDPSGLSGQIDCDNIAETIEIMRGNGISETSISYIISTNCGLSIAPTNTATSTVIPPTNTATSTVIPTTSTTTNTVTSIPTGSPTVTQTSTATSTPTEMCTLTLTPYFSTPTLTPTFTPTYTPDPNATQPPVDDFNVLVFGLRFDATATLSPEQLAAITGRYIPISFGIDINLEYQTAPYYWFGGNRPGGGWFLNLAVEGGTSSGINVSGGIIAGYVGCPTEFGETSYVFIGGDLLLHMRQMSHFQLVKAGLYQEH